MLRSVVVGGAFLAVAPGSSAFTVAPPGLSCRPALAARGRSLCRLGTRAARLPSRAAHTTMQLEVLPALELSGVVDVVQSQVAALTLDDIAGGLFAFSLFPYLGFLYHLGKPETKTPELGLFGFKFLLAFVAVSIPAAIAAKVMYGAQLADVDWLHGGAESFLAITNYFIVVGFRRAVQGGTPGFKDAPMIELLSGPIATASALAGTLYLMAQGLPALGSAHAEPANALSFPTWMVHTSSLIEWLTAMGLVWRYAAVSGNPRWKGLTWGMLPFHSSGLCACTYHVFYNAAPVGGLIALQSLLTVVGDMTCWYAAYRIYDYARSNPEASGINSGGSLPPVGRQTEADPSTSTVYDNSDSGDTTWDLAGIKPEKTRAGIGMESEAAYFAKLTALCVAASAVVKWGELQVDFPFEPTYTGAAALIGVPTLLNVLTWLQRSQSDDDDFNEFY